jgi:hypothetical protein
MDYLRQDLPSCLDNPTFSFAVQLAGTYGFRISESDSEVFIGKVSVLKTECELNPELAVKILIQRLVAQALKEKHSPSRSGGLSEFDCSGRHITEKSG